MSETRLNGLTMLNIHKPIVVGINKVVETFARKKNIMELEDWSK